MKNQGSFRTLPAVIAGGMLFVLGGASAAAAQAVIPGFNRVDQSDVTGPSVTSGDQVAGMFGEPGTVQSMVCPVAWGIRTAGESLSSQLAANRMPAALDAGGEARAALAGQDRLLRVLEGGPEAKQAEQALAAALSAGENNMGASAAARRLASRLNGLLAVTQRIDPEKPGSAAATRLSRAIGAYNTFLEESSDRYLATSPDELAAIHAVLNRMVIAGMENQDRAVEPWRVDANGLACAPAVPVLAPTPVEPEPAPPIERAMEVCILDGRQLRTLAAVYRPETGDTVVIVQGERRPLSEVYDLNAGYAEDALWFAGKDAVQYAGREYKPFGIERIVEPNELVYNGELQGVNVFVQAGESTPPEVFYVPVRPGCEVQPYRAVEEIRVRG